MRPRFARSQSWYSRICGTWRAGESERMVAIMSRRKRCLNDGNPARSEADGGAQMDKRVHASHLRYDEGMKDATIPSVRIEPAFRAEVEAVLTEGETLSQFVEAAVRASVRRRRIGAEFIERGLRARDEARRDGAYVDAEAVLRGLQSKIEAARKKTPAKRK